MRTKSEIFKINDSPMLVPDEEVDFKYEDLDDSSSGRDENGIMHRIVCRFKVGSWSFSYDHLTEEEKRYMENLFPDSADFSFTHPDRKDASVLVTSRAYRSKYGISWKNVRTGLWSGYSFNIIEC